MDRPGDGFHAGEVVRDAWNNVLEMGMSCSLSDVAGSVEAILNVKLREDRRRTNADSLDMR